MHEAYDRRLASELNTQHALGDLSYRLPDGMWGGVRVSVKGDTRALCLKLTVAGILCERERDITLNHRSTHILNTGLNYLLLIAWLSRSRPSPGVKLSVELNQPRM